MPLEIAASLEADMEQLAAAEGVSPGQFLDRLLHAQPVQTGPQPDDGEGDFGGKSVADVMREICFVRGGPSDLAAQAELYLAQGFGETGTAPNREP